MDGTASAVSGLNAIWVLFGADWMLFMQAGFAMVETNFTQAENAGNILMKDLLNFALVCLAYGLLGYAPMFGKE